MKTDEPDSGKAGPSRIPSDVGGRVGFVNSGLHV